MFDLVRFAMSRKQELMDEIEKEITAELEDDRVVPPGAAAIIIEAEEDTEFICIRLVHALGVEQEGGDVPLPTMVALQALRLLDADMAAVDDPILSLSLPVEPQEPS